MERLERGRSERHERRASEAEQRRAEAARRVASERRPLHVRMAVGPLALERLLRPRWWKQMEQQRQAEQQRRRQEQRKEEQRRQREARLEAVMAARETAALAAAKREAEARMQMALFEQAIAEAEAGAEAAARAATEVQAGLPQQQRKRRNRNGHRAGTHSRMTGNQLDSTRASVERAAASVWPHTHHSNAGRASRREGALTVGSYLSGLIVAGLMTPPPP